jgi:acetyl-CoA synthetase-like protein/AMP-binding enzyme
VVARDPQHAAASGIAEFTRYVRDRRGVSIPDGDYAALHAWSVRDLAGFWSAVAEFVGVRFHQAPAAVLGVERMPGAEWFPGATLNYAEHVLSPGPGRGDGDVAVVFAREDGLERQVTRAESLRLQMDLGPGERFFWFTTTGWMMWNLLVSGLLVGATVVLFDGNPGYPDLSVLWRLAERHHISYFGTSAPFIQSCLKAGLRPRDAFDLPALRAVGSTGSPLPAEGFRWLADAVGRRVQICSISGGTDLCTPFLSAAPTVAVWLGEISCAALGAAAAAYDTRGQEVIDKVGKLVLTRPMPSMPVAFWTLTAPGWGGLLRRLPGRVAARRLGAGHPAGLIRHLRAQRL